MLNRQHEGLQQLAGSLEGPYAPFWISVGEKECIAIRTVAASRVEPQLQSNASSNCTPSVPVLESVFECARGLLQRARSFPVILLLQTFVKMLSITNALSEQLHYP